MSHIENRTNMCFEGYNRSILKSTGTTEMKESTRQITPEIASYFLKYMRKKLASADKLGEVFVRPDDTAKLVEDLRKFESNLDLEAINKWLLGEVTEIGQQRFWTAHRSIKWSRNNPSRDRIVIASLAKVIRAHTGVDDLNSAIASLLPKKLVKPLESELAEIRKSRLNR